MVAAADTASCLPYMESYVVQVVVVALPDHADLTAVQAQPSCTQEGCWTS